MDNLEYLNQISQSNRPVKRSLKSSDRKTNLILKFSIAGVVLFFLMMAFGAMVGNLNTKSDDLAKQIYTRTVNLNSSLNTYNRDLKSSRLRAIGVSRPFSPTPLISSQIISPPIAKTKTSPLMKKLPLLRPPSLKN